MIDEILDRFGREKFGDRFVRGITPDNQPFTVMEYIGPDGEIWHEEHSFFHLEDEYKKWKEVSETRKPLIDGNLDNENKPN